MSKFSRMFSQFFKSPKPTGGGDSSLSSWRNSLNHGILKGDWSLNSWLNSLSRGGLKGNWSLGSWLKSLNRDTAQIYTPRLRRNGEAVFDYDFMMSLNEKDYPYYLSQAYLVKTGQKLNLRHPKTLNEKIQWLKLFDNKQQKSELTDKVLVRDWVREIIGDEFLKSVLWIGDKFDDIPFNSLPFSFIVKANHGCKWHFIIKDKEKFLNEKKLFNTTKIYMENWLIQSFFGWSDFETQYLNINPKIIIEPLFKEFEEVEVWCFNGTPKIIQNFQYDNKKTRFYHTFDENFNSINLSFRAEEKYFETQADEILKKAVELSKTLANGFKFVRIDWMVYQNKLYFAEMTFTPYSGFIFFTENHNELQIKLGNMLNLKGD